MTTSSNRTARRGAARRVPAPAPSGRPQKPSEYTGVRLRQWGRWAAEVRVPGTRQKLWIGTFETDRQAALAYDAAVFCFFGERAPKARKTNFPAAPRPEISESERLKLSVADVKVICEKHAREVDALLPPLDDADSTAAPDDLVVAPATPGPVDAPPAGAGGPAPPDSLDEDDELDQMIRDFDIEAFQAELDSVTYLVSDGEYTELSA